MATFVLVHGAFGSPAELAPVIPWLEALGHRAIAVDLPCADPAATLDDYARTVVEAMAGIEGSVAPIHEPPGFGSSHCTRGAAQHANGADACWLMTTRGSFADVRRRQGTSFREP